MKNQAKIRYTDTAYVIDQQWHIGGLAATFPVVHQFLQRRLADQQKKDADAKCRCLKSEPLLSERKQRRRKSRSLERQRSSRRIANNPITANGIDTVDSSFLAHEESTTDEDEEPRAAGPSAVVAEVYHRVDSSLVQDDETSSTKTIVNRWSSESAGEKSKLAISAEDCNRNRLDVPDLMAGPTPRTSLVSPVVLRKQFFEPISETSTSCDDDDRSATSTSDYATVQFINQVSGFVETFINFQRKILYYNSRGLLYCSRF